MTMTEPARPLGLAGLFALPPRPLSPNPMLRHAGLYKTPRSLTPPTPPPAARGSPQTPCKERRVPSGSYVPPTGSYVQPMGTGSYVPPMGSYVPPMGSYVPPMGSYVPPISPPQDPIGGSFLAISPLQDPIGGSILARLPFGSQRLPSPLGSQRLPSPNCNTSPNPSGPLSGQNAVHRCPTPRKGPKPRTGRLTRVLCYGDSNTAGFHPETGEHKPYGDYLIEALSEAGLDIAMTCCGLDGLTAKEMVQYAHDEVVPDMFGRLGKGLMRLLSDTGPVDLVILMAGTNDIGHSRSVDGTLKSILQLQRMCSEQGASVIVLGPPTNPASPDGESLKRTQVVANQRDWPRTVPGVAACYDSEELVPRQPLFWNKDDLHLSTIGLAELGRRLAPLVFPVLYRLSLQEGRPQASNNFQHASARFPLDAGQQSPRVGYGHSSARFPLDAGQQSPQVGYGHRERRSPSNGMQHFGSGDWTPPPTTGGFQRFASTGLLLKNPAWHQDAPRQSSTGLKCREVGRSKSQGHASPPHPSMSIDRLRTSFDPASSPHPSTQHGHASPPHPSMSIDRMRTSSGELPSGESPQRQSSQGMMLYPSTGFLQMVNPQMQRDLTPPRQRHGGASSKFSIGDGVEAFSNSLQVWVKATIVQTEDSLVALRMLMPDGSSALKILPQGHRSIRKL